MQKLNKDFYDLLPSFACETLDSIIKRYSDREWFEEAWNKYRQHVLSSDRDNVRMPGFVFKEYIDNDKKNGWKNYLEVYDPDNSESINHHGILGQRWGIRRYQNEDGTLTEAGKKHYQKLDERWIKRKTDRIYERAYKKSEKEMKKFVRKEITGKNVTGRTAVNIYNRKLAETMREKTKDIRSPSGKIVTWVAKRGEVGVFMALSDPNYDINKLKNGVWSSGKIGYKSQSVDITQR